MKNNKKNKKKKQNNKKNGASKIKLKSQSNNKYNRLSEQTPVH